MSEDLLASAASKAFAEGLRTHCKLLEYGMAQKEVMKLLLSRSKLFVTVDNNGSRFFGMRANPLSAALRIRHMV